jgi:hypothetical protein
VVERWRVVEGGNVMEVTFAVDDLEIFMSSATRDSVTGACGSAFREEACAENNQHPFDDHIPVANKPNF